MEIVSCDGGEYADPQNPINSYPQNVLQDDTSVYCTKSNKCNLLLKHVGGMPFTLTKIVVKAPRTGFDAPIQEGLVFIAMEDEKLLDRTSQYEVQWNPNSYRQRHRQSHIRDERAVASGLLMRQVYCTRLGSNINRYDLSNKAGQPVNFNKDRRASH